MSEEMEVAPAAEETLGDEAIIKGYSYEEKLKFASVIAKPMASKKQCKRVIKLLKKASQQKGQVAYGIKNVQTTIRKGGTGIVILAGDVTPIDIISHLPTLCEDKEIPYIFLPTKYDIGDGLGKNACIMALIKEGEAYQSAYDEVLEDIKYAVIPS